MNDDPKYRRDDWPLQKRDLDLVYLAIREAFMANRSPIEVQTAHSRAETEVGPEGRLFGISWVLTEFIAHDTFRLLYDKGSHTEHAFHEVIDGR